MMMVTVMMIGVVVLMMVVLMIILIHYLSSPHGGTVTLTASRGYSKAVVCSCPRDAVSSVKEKVAAVKKDIEDRVSCWKLPKSKSFGRTLHM